MVYHLLRWLDPQCHPDALDLQPTPVRFPVPLNALRHRSSKFAWAAVLELTAYEKKQMPGVDHFGVAFWSGVKGWRIPVIPAPLMPRLVHVPERAGRALHYFAVDHAATFVPFADGHPGTVQLRGMVPDLHQPSIITARHLLTALDPACSHAAVYISNPHKKPEEHALYHVARWWHSSRWVDDPGYPHGFGGID
jgi:hypothetical protein